MDIRLTMVVDEPQGIKDMDQDERLELMEEMLEGLSSEEALAGFIPEEYILHKKVVDQSTIEIGIDLLRLIGRKPGEDLAEFAERFDPDAVDEIMDNLGSAMSKSIAPSAGGVNPAPRYTPFPGMKVQRYIPKPKAVSAIRVMNDDESLAAVIEFVGYKFLDANDAREAGGVFILDSHSTTSFANMGDYIIKSDDGYFSSCSAEEFETRYDLANEAAE